MATKKPPQPIFVRRVWRQHELILDIPGGATQLEASRRLGVDVMHRKTDLVIELYDRATDRTFPPVKFGAAVSST